MSKILQFDNKAIFADIAEEVAILQSPASPGSNVTLVLDNNDGLADNDFIVIGETGEGQSELIDINNTVTAGTDIRVSTLKYPHEVGTQIYLVKYDQIKFYHAATPAGAKTTLATKNINVDEELTEYVDTAHSTGYGFFALYNSVTTDLSDYSSAFPYSLMKMGAKAQIRRLVKGFFQDDIDEDIFDMLLTIAQDEVFRIFPWRFREKTVTFETTADQKIYDFVDDVGITDFGTLAFLSYNDEPVGFASFKENEALNWGNLISSSPRVAHIWANGLEFTPAPDAEVTVTMKYWKLAPELDEETTETDVTMPQMIAFRILQDLWAMPDPKKAAYWEARFQQQVPLLRNSDKKQVSRFPTLTRNSMLRKGIYDQIDNPSISV